MSGALLIVFCSALWATDAIFRLPLAKSVDSLTIVLLQQMICVISMAPLFIIRRKELRTLGLSGWASVAFVGIMGEALGTFLFTASYHNINPSIAILLQKVQPIFAVLAARVILKEKANRHFYWWAALALVAGTMVSLPDLWKWTEVATGFPSLRMSDNARNLGILQALGAAFVWGLSTVFGKWVTTQISFPVTAFLRFAWGLVGMGLIALSRLGDMSPSFATQLGTILTTPEHLRAILYIALIPGVLAMNLYYAGLTTTKASAATFAELFFPVAAVAINWVLLDQALSGPQLFGGALLLVAVYFINKQNQRKHKK